MFPITSIVGHLHRALIFTIREHLNPFCGSDRVSIGDASSVISGFDIKIDSGMWVSGAAVFGQVSLETAPGSKSKSNSNLVRSSVGHRCGLYLL